MGSWRARSLRVGAVAAILGVALVAGVGAAWAGGPAAASASSGSFGSPGSPESAESERRFVDLTAGERASRSLASLAAQPEDLVRVARDHAARMAAEHRLHHNPNLATEVRDWQVVGENVGRGPSVDAVHAAFMNSPSHRDNIVSSNYTQVGIGVVIADDGEIWVAEVFRKPTGATEPSSATAPASEVGEAPVAVAQPAAGAARTVEPRAQRSSRARPAATGSPAPTSLAPASAPGPDPAASPAAAATSASPSGFGRAGGDMSPPARPEPDDAADAGGGGVLVLQAFAASLLLGVAWKTVRIAPAIVGGRRLRRGASSNLALAA